MNHERCTAPTKIKLFQNDIAVVSVFTFGNGHRMSNHKSTGSGHILACRSAELKRCALRAYSISGTPSRTWGPVAKAQKRPWPGDFHLPFSPLPTPPTSLFSLFSLFHRLPTPQQPCRSSSWISGSSSRRPGGESLFFRSLSSPFGFLVSRIFSLSPAARRKDAKSVKIVKTAKTGVTKFKIRCSKVRRVVYFFPAFSTLLSTPHSSPPSSWPHSSFTRSR